MSIHEEVFTYIPSKVEDIPKPTLNWGNATFQISDSDILESLGLPGNYNIANINYDGVLSITVIKD